MYRTLYELAEKTEADILVTGAFVEVESDGRQEILENPAAAGLYTGEKLEKLREKMLYSGHFYRPGIYPVVWNKWFQRDILLKNLLPIDDRISLGEDMACTYPCLMDAGSVFIYSDEIFYHYRIRKDAMTKAGHGSGSGKIWNPLPVFGKDFSKGKNAEDCRTAELSQSLSGVCGTAGGAFKV